MSMVPDYSEFGGAKQRNANQQSDAWLNAIYEQKRIIEENGLILGQPKVFIKQEKKKKMGSIFTSKLRMELEEIKHKHTLELERATEKFTREKQLWDEDKNLLIKKLKQEHDLKLQETVTLLKLSAEQSSKQQELNYLRQIEEIKSKAQTEIVGVKTSLAEEYYNKLSDALNKLHTEGNNTTKFTQELALKMLDKAPPQTERIELLRGEIVQK